MHHASPQRIADFARQNGSRSVAYTYNDPVIFLEYAVNFAAVCRAQDIQNVAVTAGYICDAPREEFFGAMDAANIDLKGFTERFYKKLTGSEIQPVLETIAYVVQETSCWVELTTLLIPGENDNPKEIKALSR
jgi:pyruvate formate lyase activating enzyme